MKNKLKVARAQNGKMTQEELANRVNASRQTILAIEASKFNPSVRLALKIARELGETVESLFQLTEEDFE
jgi:putative transcriptional regulator